MRNKGEIQRDPLTAREVGNEIRRQLARIDTAVKTCDEISERFARNAAGFWARTLTQNYTDKEQRKSKLTKRVIGVLTQQNDSAE